MDLEKYRAAIDSLHENPFFKTLEPYLPAAGTVVDLGCGTGQGALWLAEKNLAVIAIDNDPEMLAIAKAKRNHDAINYILGDMTEFPKSACEVVVAVFSLFFLRLEELESCIANIQSNLNPGGIFAGQLLGPRDDFLQDGATGLTSEHAKRLLNHFDILSWDEVERDGKTVWGEPKHWHVYHFIVRQPG